MLRGARRHTRPYGWCEGGQARNQGVVYVPRAARRRRGARFEYSRGGGEGLQVRHRDPQRGADRHRSSDGRVGTGGARPLPPLLARAQAVWACDRRLPGRAAPSGAAGDRAAGGEAAGLQRGAHEGARPAGGAGRCNGKAVLRTSGGEDCLQMCGAHGRSRLHEGIWGREILSRRQDWCNLRRHFQHPVEHHRKAALCSISMIMRRDHDNTLWHRSRIPSTSTGRHAQAASSACCKGLVAPGLSQVQALPRTPSEAHP
mmetsp:Transcript_10145/g.24428  ORF Transcript_10145/g.24428 Transcript_10145/m.24428 type:complete len:258 (+) Transcript_10145:678-1451(+)